MNNKAHLRPKDFDSNGDIIPMACKEVKGDLISREALKKAISNNPLIDFTDDDIFKIIDSLPTEKGQFEEKVIELFNKYDPLLLHIGDKIEPVRNTSKQDCYNLLFEIGELFEWRRVLFKKYHGGSE